MIDNRQVQRINQMLHNQIVQRFSVLAVALLVIGSVAYFGTHRDQSSNAASVGILSMTSSAGANAVTVGSNVNVTLIEDSGTDPVNAVQASVTYDATKLQYVSMTEGTAFPTIAATSTGTAGLIRVGRGTNSGTSVTGVNTIVVLTFKVLGNSGSTSLAYDPSFSFIVRSTDNVNILTANTGTSISMKLPAPTISSVAPTSGPTTGGTSVTLTGTNFVSGATVKVGGIAATGVVFNSATSITATTAAHAAGAVSVDVTNPDVQTATLPNSFTYVAPVPTVTTVAPTSGSTTGGTTITITGANFVSGATVTVGGTAATNVTFASATSLTAVTPAHASGAADVVVKNPDNQSATKTGGFTYTNPAPTLSTVSPASGLTSGGTRITLTGTNFLNGATVSVGGAAGTGTIFVSSTSVTTVVPAHAAGSVSVVITNPDSQSATKAAAFAYVNPAPTISSISPTSGKVTGGTTVVITGTNFLSGATVAFGPTAAASVTFTSPTSLSVVTPVGTAGGKEVVVTNPDGQATGGTAPIFTYLSNPGDANNDGRVNALDLSILITRDGQNYPPADFNGDGTVGSADLAILIPRWTW